MNTSAISGAPDAAPARLPDERVLALVAESMTELTGKPWELRTDASGLLVKGPGSTGIRIGTPHDRDYRHIELDFLINVDHPEIALVNCGTGRQPDPEAAVREAVESWRSTTAVVGLEMMTREGRYATHLPSDYPGGFPGWHTIAGQIVGWGFGEESNAKQQWFAEAHPWQELAPLLSADLDRPHLNGIRLMVGQGGDSVHTEVRINGRANPAAAEALAGMDWPRTERFNVAHLFLLLVHPDPPEQATEA